VGEVVEITPTGPIGLSDPKHHFSYPSCVTENGVEYLIPEIARWSTPAVYRIADSGLEEIARLRVESEPRILDPTFFWDNGRLYLFGNISSVGTGALYLWTSDSLFGIFHLHPSSPIRVSAMGARMAGGLLNSDEGIYRFGQNLTGAYGDGLCVFKVDRLSATDYREELIGTTRFAGLRGPHTINFDDRRIVFDWYKPRFSVLAGVRRIKARLREAPTR